MSTARSPRRVACLLCVLTLLLSFLFTGCETVPKFPDNRSIKMSSKTEGNITWPQGNHYQGGVFGGKPHGTGVMKYADGRIYRGQWKQGKRNGTGLMHYKSGYIYSGLWRADLKNGKGVLTFPDKRSNAVGLWYKDKFYQGIVDKSNGHREEGKFRDHPFLIEGTRVYANGIREEGKFAKNVLSSGVRTFPDGSVEKGFWDTKTQYRDGQQKYIFGRFIQGEKYDSQGRLIKAGIWDSKTGKPKYYVMNYLHGKLGATKDEGRYNSEGQRHGWSRFSRENGYLRVGRYKNGKQSGSWLTVDPSPQGLYSGRSTKSVVIYEDDKNMEQFTWIYPQTNFRGVPRGVHFKRGSAEWPEGSDFSAYSLDPNTLYLGTQGDKQGRADGTAPALFIGGMDEVDLGIRGLSKRRINNVVGAKRQLFRELKSTTWEAGRLVSAEVTDPTHQLYYVGEVDDHGRKHGKGRQSRVTIASGSSQLIYDNQNLENVVYEHGKAIGSTSFHNALNTRSNYHRRQNAERQRQYEARQAARRAAERAEELAEKRADRERRQADLARRNALRQRSRDKAAAKADRWNQAQAKRKQEMNQFNRQVNRHNRNLAQAFKETKAAKQRQVQAQKQREEAERNRLARSRQAQLQKQREEAKRQQLAQERQIQVQRQREEAERQRLAQRRAVEEQRREEAEKKRLEIAQAEKEKMAARKAASNPAVKPSGPPAPTGLTPPPGRLPEVPKRGYSAWTRYAEVRDGSASPLLRLEYRIRITTGLGDEPYVNVAWRLTNLSSRTIFDAAVTKKIYATNEVSGKEGSSESFGSTLTPNETSTKLPDVMPGSRLLNFQLKQPGIRLKLERGASYTHWQTLGSVSYY